MENYVICNKSISNDKNSLDMVPIKLKSLSLPLGKKSLIDDFPS